MHFTVSSFLALLFLSVSVLSSPTLKSTRTIEQRKLKQATRDGIVSRGSNPLRRQNYASCGTCSDCCPGYCTMPGQVQHAVYANTEVPTGSGLFRYTSSTQTSLERCIRQCCANPSICRFARYEPSVATNNCGLYGTNQGNPTFVYPTTNTLGVTTIANRVTCADNAQAAGNRQCCNAPLFVQT